MTEHFETRSKKVRGMAQKSLDLIDAMYTIAKASQPITGRGVGYKLFTARLTPSMERPVMQRVYRLLKEARERGDELDAMDPQDLRLCVENAIREWIEPVAWERCEVVNAAEQESLKTILQKWGAP